MNRRFRVESLENRRLLAAGVDGTANTYRIGEMMNGSWLATESVEVAEALGATPEKPKDVLRTIVPLPVA